MSVELSIHSLLLDYTDNQEVIEVQGSTVGECLHLLVAQFPDIKEVLFENDNKLLKSTEIMVNGEDAYPEELAKPVKDGDKVYVMMMMGCLG